MRRTIVFEVMIMRETLKNVCDRYSINFSSAKNVIQIYRKEGRLEKKVQKNRKSNRARKANASDDSDEDGLDEGDSEDEDQRMETLAPEAQRCKLNLFVKPIEEGDNGEPQAMSYFTMNLDQLLQASPELSMDLRTQFQLKSLGQNLNENTVKIPKNENFCVESAPFGLAANITEQEKQFLLKMHEKCQNELAKYHHLYKQKQT